MLPARPLDLFYVFVLLAVLPALSSCSTEEPGLTETDSSLPIEVVAGEEVNIVLESNPTTGYEWHLSAEVDPAILEHVGQSFVAPTGDLVGTPGHEVWTFLAVGPGDTALSFDYVRAWEQPPVPQGSRSFAVIVSDD
jgi:inhibitor of cysteine peptidase